MIRLQESKLLRNWKTLGLPELTEKYTQLIRSKMLKQSLYHTGYQLSFYTYERPTQK